MVTFACGGDRADTHFQNKNTLEPRKIPIVGGAYADDALHDIGVDGRSPQVGAMVLVCALALEDPHDRCGADLVFEAAVQEDPSLIRGPEISALLRHGRSPVKGDPEADPR